MFRENDIIWGLALPLAVVLTFVVVPRHFVSDAAGNRSVPGVDAAFPPKGAIRPKMAKILLKQMYRSVTTASGRLSRDRALSTQGGVSQAELRNATSLYADAVETYNGFVGTSIDTDTAVQFGYPAGIPSDRLFHSKCTKVSTDSL